MSGVCVGVGFLAVESALFYTYGCPSALKILSGPEQRRRVRGSNASHVIA